MFLLRLLSAGYQPFSLSLIYNLRYSHLLIWSILSSVANSFCLLALILFINFSKVYIQDKPGIIQALHIFCFKHIGKVYSTKYYYESFKIHFDQSVFVFRHRTSGNVCMGVYENLYDKVCECVWERMIKCMSVYESV